jgi:hypothetical protein
MISTLVIDCSFKIYLMTFIKYVSQRHSTQCKKHITEHFDPVLLKMITSELYSMDSRVPTDMFAKYLYIYMIFFIFLTTLL